MNYERCFCGCGKRAEDRHHIVRQQELRRAAGGFTQTRDRLLNDPRNIVGVARRCHANHHSRARPYHLWMLTDAVFTFAAEVLGAGKAHGYLARHYNGSDPRLDALLSEWEQAA